MALPERRAPETAYSPDVGLWQRDDYTDTYPSIYAFVNDTTYSSGKARLTGSISMFTKVGTLTFAVNDNDRQLTAYVSAGTWAEALQMIEDGIREDSLQWRKRTPFNNSQKPPF